MPTYVPVGIICFVLGMITPGIMKWVFGPEKEKEEKLKGRMGTVSLSFYRMHTPLFSGNSSKVNYSATALVEEIDRIGNLSKLKIVSISGTDSDTHGYIRDCLSGYVDDNKIKWIKESRTCGI